MKRKVAARIVIVLCISLSFGFVISEPEDPAVDAARTKYEESWKEYFSTRYDLGALHTFLISEVVGAGARAGVDLSRSNVSDKWSFTGTALKCGDWSLYISDPGLDFFKLNWRFSELDTKQGSKAIKDISISCSREWGGKKFRIEKEEIYEDEFIVLIP